MNIQKIDAITEMSNGRFKATSIVRIRLREMMKAGIMSKMNKSVDESIEAIMDEVLSGEISIKKTEPETKGKGK
jgi:division protein CdvB (Snf7/Vps24/ESCRT-III family)